MLSTTGIITSKDIKTLKRCPVLPVVPEAIKFVSVGRMGHLFFVALLVLNPHQIPKTKGGAVNIQQGVIPKTIFIRGVAIKSRSDSKAINGQLVPEGSNTIARKSPVGVTSLESINRGSRTKLMNVVEANQDLSNSW